MTPDGTLPDMPEGAPQIAESGGMTTSVSGDSDVAVARSLVGYAAAGDDLSLERSAAGAVVARGDADLVNSAAAALVARSVTGERILTCTTIAEEVHITGGWIGMALAKDIEVSEDSRIIIGPAGATIIAAAILGVFGIAAVLLALAARRAMAWRPKVPAVSWRRMGE